MMPSLQDQQRKAYWDYREHKTMNDIRSLMKNRDNK